MKRNSQEQSQSRRDFLKAGATGAVGSAVLTGFPAILSGASVSNAIKVGLVGCGGRGTGAAAQALKADPGVELTALADVFPEKIDACLDRLRSRSPEKTKGETKRFTGLDGYQRVIDSVDVVLLATPPGFRPQHLRAAVNAGKHIFCEKPVSVDAPGARYSLESAKLAKEKGISLVAGFCWRYSNFVKDTFQQVHSGAIGDIVSYHATYYTNPVKPMPPASERPANISDVEWQVRNWYNFCWLCGDSIVEQAVHSVDKVAWAMHDQPPVSCVAVGGRQFPAEAGNIYDHFEVNYLYPKNVRASVACRQIESCYNENADYILGSKGSCTIGRGPVPRIEGATNWTFEGTKNDMYQAELDALMASIREGKPINDGDRLATSTMLAIMGRMAAYTGQEVTWDQAMNSKEAIVPEKLDWNMRLAVAPMPIPGKTKLV